MGPYRCEEFGACGDPVRIVAGFLELGALEEVWAIMHQRLDRVRYVQLNKLGRLVCNNVRRQRSISPSQEVPYFCAVLEGVVCKRASSFLKVAQALDAEVLKPGDDSGLIFAESSTDLTQGKMMCCVRVCWMTGKSGLCF